MKRILYCGNFEPFHSTENHVRQALEALGHSVVPVQENKTCPEELRTLIMFQPVDMVLYTRTWGLDGPEMLALWQQCKAKGIPTVSYHLDLYYKLERRDLWERLARKKIFSLEDDPFWRTEFCFTVDGDPEAEAYFRARGINHYYLRAGVFHKECYMANADRIYDVVFVGSGGYHPEWPYRQQLLSWLRRTYGDRFWKFGAPENLVRNDDLNRLYAQSKVVVGDSLCPDFIKPNYWCVDEKTEILTQRGWLSCDQVSPGDLAYSLDPATGMGVWAPVNAVHVFPTEERDMLVLEGKRHSSVTTLNHRWLVEYSTTEQVDVGPRDVCPECGFIPSGDRTRAVSIHRAHTHGVRRLNHHRGITRRTFKESKDLQCNDKIPLAARCADLPNTGTYSDAFVELVAWAWTEGSISSGKKYSGISQSHRVNARYVARIRAALFTLFGPALTKLKGSKQPAWREVRTDTRGMTTFYVNVAVSKLLWAVAPNRNVTADFIMALTYSQLCLFIKTSIDADGCRKISWRNGTPSEGVTICQKEGERLDAFEMACALLGIPTNRTWQKTGWMVHLKKRYYTQPFKAAREGTATAQIETRTGRVWCPTTATGTWLARRRGTVYFTGNSDRVYETLGRGGFLIHPYIQGLEEEFSNGKDLVFYQYGNFEDLKILIDAYLQEEGSREFMRRHGHRKTKERYTYVHRMQQLLNTVFAGELSL